MVKEIRQRNEQVKPNEREMRVLRENFPGCFRADGTFDLVRFQEAIKETTDVVSEGYELKFLGKEYAKMLAALDTETVLVPDEEQNAQPENAASGNIYLSGDNLDGLKHLLKSYAHSVKCIYIDPPYNTGSDGFVYNDTFAFTTAELVQKLGIDEEEAARILDMTTRGSASHSAWLTFLYPRLMLARDLLSEDGVIFISIDDNEQANLKLLCDDIFGENNFVDTVIWQKKYSPQNAVEWFSENHDFILVYARQKEKWHPQLLPRTEEMNARYRNLDNDPRGPWKAENATAQAGHGTASQFYVLKAPNGKEHTLPSGRCWLYTQPVMQKMIAEQRVWFGEDGNNVPAIKRFLSEVKQGIACQTIWRYEDVGHTQEGKKELKALFSEGIPFETPKPTRLLRRILQLSGEDDFTVLDFFGGSATTAEAVMQENIENDKHLRYILVQIADRVEAGSEAEKTGFHTLDEIGRERIRRAAEKLRAAHPETQADLGFRHYTLSAASQDTLDKLDAFDPTRDADMFVKDNWLAKFGKETVLATWLVRDHYGFAKPEVLDFAGYPAYFIQHHLYLLDEGLSEEAMEALLVRYETDGRFNPENLVLFGYSFTFDERASLAINVRRLKDTGKSLAVHIDVRY